MKRFFAAISRRRALRQARRGVALVHAAISNTHLPRATRRRIMHALAHGRVDFDTIFRTEDAS